MSCLNKITDDIEDDTENNIKKLEQKIRVEIRNQKLCLESYGMHIDRHSAAECTSDSLISLLPAVDKRKLCKLSLPSLMVGNIVASQVNSQPTALQIAFGVLSEQKTTIETVHVPVWNLLFLQ